VFVGQTPSVAAVALLDVVVASCPLEDFSTTSSSATQPTSTKRYSTFVTLRLGSDVVAVWHCPKISVLEVLLAQTVSAGAT